MNRFLNEHVGLAIAGVLFASLAAAACSRAESKQPVPPPPAPAVTVATANAGDITDFDDFTGRFEAVEKVELRPRVSGYIDEVRFVEGKEVKKGEVLFVIDQRPYKIELQRAQSELARIKSQADLALSESQRAERLLASRAISQEERDQRVSQNSQALSDISSAQAAVDAAKLNLEFTQVTSPIAGRVSRAVVTAGNYVTAGSNVLTSVVSLDPIYVSFDGDEQSFLKYQSRVAGAGFGGGSSSGSTAGPVFVGLANEDGFPHQGHLNFLDNALDPQTGTIHVRALMDNKDRRFTPGLFARVRLPGSEHYQATLVPDAAVATDQDRRYVLVVGKDDTVEYRAVELGATQDEQRVVRAGLKPGERVVVSGLQRARPGSKVSPQQAPEPATAKATTGARVADSAP
jgi:RND family efflux transporter MFP subunit